MSQKNDFDFFDKMFDQLENGDSFINKSVAEFGREVRASVNQSIKSKGYDNLTGMVTDSLNGRKAKKPYPVTRHVMTPDYKNRYEYLNDVFQLINYEGQYRGYYKDGHAEAISRSLSYMKDAPEDVLRMEKYLAESLSSYRRRRSKDDRYTEGYVDGLLLFQSELNNAKKEMMERVKKSVASL